MGGEGGGEEGATLSSIVQMCVFESENKCTLNLVYLFSLYTTEVSMYVVTLSGFDFHVFSKSSRIILRSAIFLSSQQSFLQPHHGRLKRKGH